ncbi:MAG: YHS domain-containing (seleno)protein [Lacibacter sp.]
MKQQLLFVLLFVTLHTSAQTSEIFAPDSIALRGYDVVAFYTEGKAITGSDKFMYSWKNVKWFFASANHLFLFKADPAKYEPQYGGYCAYGLARGYKAPTVADTWYILDGKLYFNYNQKVKTTWQKEKERYIDSANRKWPLLRLN